MVVIQHLQHDIRDLVGAVGPDVDDFVVALPGRDDPPAILLVHVDNLFLGLFDFPGLFLGDDHVMHPHGDAGLGCRGKPKVLEIIQYPDGFGLAALAVTVPDDIPKRALVYNDVWIPDLLGPNLAEHNAANRGLDDTALRIPVRGLLPEVGIGQAHYVVNLQFAIMVRKQHLLLGAEQPDGLLLLAHHAARLGRDVVAAKRNVLGRGDDRLAAGRRKDVVGCHHQEAGLQLGLDGQRDMHRHLVTVKVGVVGTASQRMQTDGLPLDQGRLKGLDGKPVQGRRTIQQDRVLPGHLLEHVPNLRCLAVDQFLGGTNGVNVAEILEPADDERLKQHERHFLWQTALVQLELGTDHDHRSAGVVHALAEQVLAEAPALALEHVAQRLERTVAGTGHGAAVAAVVE